MDIQERIAQLRAEEKQRQHAVNARFGDGLAALRRLVEIAKSDTGQCAKVSNFLLAWWNAGSCGGFDLTELWAVDGEIADDMVSVVRLIADRQEYPSAYGLRAEFEKMVADWRPHLLK